MLHMKQKLLITLFSLTFLASTYGYTLSYEKPSLLHSSTTSTKKLNTLNIHSWVEHANDPDCDFPIQNLPYGVFSRRESPLEKHIGVAIGNQIFDLNRAVDAGILQELTQEAKRALKENSLNSFMELGKESWQQTRETITSLLRTDSYQLRDSETLKKFLFVNIHEAIMHLPFKVGDYTDFYTSLHHATNVGKRFRPQNPLLPNFKHLPVGYHGRASSIVISDTPINRPYGQTKDPTENQPTFQPTKKLDYEMELGIVVGPGNEIGKRIKMEEASEHLFGMVILNDWSARDVQKWEYQPLGPFNSKNFATTISPWVVTIEALEPYKLPGPNRTENDPDILDYLKPIDDMALDITVEVWITSKKMRESAMKPILLSRTNFNSMYWTIAQMLVHHTSTGANMRPGDLFGSGTISGQEDGTKGCLLEIVEPGEDGILLSDGTRRIFLEDGDEIIMKAYSHKEGMPRIGFGECRGIVLEAM
ncbi:MAG: fumarylacetoacetase [Chlamydiota bacterium]|nr:fumarylacetoacetase [Chlamydiota bacterium]